MYRMIALDLDGTLLDDNSSISEKNRDVLQQFNRAGGIIVLASGRMTSCILPFEDSLAIDCVISSYNGAMVRLKKREGRKIIYHNPVPLEYGDLMIDYCTKNRFLLNYYLEEALYAQSSPMLNRYSDIYSDQTGAIYRFIEDISRLKNNTPTKMILITDSVHDDITRRRDYQYNYFKDRLGDRLKIVKTNPEYLEFMNKTADKGAGLKAVAEYYNIKREEIIAFGDADNDIEMLKYAGLSATPSNATAAAKKSAAEVTELDNNNSFIADFVKRRGIV